MSPWQGLDPQGQGQGLDLQGQGQGQGPDLQGQGQGQGPKLENLKLSTKIEFCSLFDFYTCSNNSLYSIYQTVD